MHKLISMKTLLVATAMFVLAAPHTASAQHQNHAKHNMLLYGSDEIFADHIVYKVPHNYQVILRIDFDVEVKQAYLAAKENFPSDTFILLLDLMDIGKIGQAERIKGELLRRDRSGKKETIKAGVTLEKEHFKVIYFDELPLSLQSTTSEVKGVASDYRSVSCGPRPGRPNKCDTWVCTPSGWACND